MSKQIIIAKLREHLAVDIRTAESIYKKGREGGEFDSIDDAQVWLKNRLLPNIVWITEVDYEKMCIDALKILPYVAATDYGSSRQRDLGQLWGDMTRGYLAEQALVLFLNKYWQITATLGHERGSVDDYAPSDIQTVTLPNTPVRVPHIDIGIKGTKWNGIWLDLPGDQFNKSHVHVMVKVGVSRDHLFAYFKHISLFKDKVLPRGINMGLINETFANQLFDELPEFKAIPAYVAGFVPRDVVYDALPYEGKKGRLHYTIKSWNGQWNRENLQQIKLLEEVEGKVKFAGIGDFSHDSGYLFNTGSLLWKPNDWEKHIIQKL